MDNRGFWITLQSIRRQLSAMPNELYLIRLIHHQTHRAFPGERLWSAEQLANTATVRFLRARNLEGCDVYIQPYGGKQNAGYILVDLDVARPSVIVVYCSGPAGQHRGCKSDPFNHAATSDSSWKSRRA